MQIKLIIWDLDDTLWRGTLADGDTVCLHEHRAALIRALNARGVVSSICSKNDPAAAENQLRAFNLWDEFVFPHIAFTPKGEALVRIISDMQLRPHNVLFVDDNRHNLEAARHALPDIHILDALDPNSDGVLDELLASLPTSGRSRLAEYRQLEAKVRDRAESDLSNSAFLRSCSIKATAPSRMDNLDFAERIVELVNRSNQLNYTRSRVSLDQLEEAIINMKRNECWSIFAWDKYGDYGLVGFVMADRIENRIEHFVFSCRAMHMGLEDYALAKVLSKIPTCDISVLDGRVGPVTPDWIEDVPFVGHEIRAGIIERLRPEADGPKTIRIMFDCQSGGIAHFSRLRREVDFDNYPRIFSLSHILTAEEDEVPTEAHLIYGAGVDYADVRWEGLADLLDQGLFEGAVQLFCERMASLGKRILVVLPAEDLPASFYRPETGLSQERTARFNQHWRSLARLYPSIDVLELTARIRARTDCSDINHYRSGFLRRLAITIDDWVESGSTQRAA